MRKIIISFLVILMIAVIGMTAFFVKSVYYVKNDNSSNIEKTSEIANERIETIKKPKPIGGEKVEEYVDEYGIKTTKYSDGVELLEYPEDVTTWNMQNKDMRTTVIYDAMLGRVWDTWNLRHYYPVTENFFNEWDNKGWKDLEELFPGYKHTKEYNSNYNFALYIDDFKKEDKEGIAHATIRSKYYDIRYDFKYYLDDDYKLDKIEYLSQEVVKDYTKEVEKRERILLMIKNGDEIHEDNEYITVLQAISSSIKEEEYSLDYSGIVEELKNKKFKENVLPINNDIGYRAFINKETADYDNKTAEVYLYYWDSHDCEKYLVSFDYNEDYYLSKYEVLNRESISLDELKKVAHIRKFGWEDKK